MTTGGAWRKLNSVNEAGIGGAANEGRWVQAATDHPAAARPPEVSEALESAMKAATSLELHPLAHSSEKTKASKE